MVAVARQRDVGGSMAEHRLGHRAIFLNIFTSFLIFLCGVQLLAKLHLLQITSTPLAHYLLRKSLFMPQYYGSPILCMYIVGISGILVVQILFT